MAFYQKKISIVIAIPFAAMAAQNQIGKFARSISLFTMAIPLFSCLLPGLWPEPAFGFECNEVFFKTTTSNRHLLDRIKVGPRELTEAEQKLEPGLQPGGLLRFEEQPMPTDSKAAMIEILSLISETRQKIFSVKDFERGGPADTGILTLGLPLIGDYSLEAAYRADYRHEAKYVLADLKLVPPFGKAIGISSNPLTTDGKINPKIGLDLSLHQDLSQYDITAKIPLDFNLNVLLELEKYKNKLEFLSKPELRKIAESNGYLRMRSLIFFRYVKAKMIEYHVKGVFKRYVALVTTPALFFAAYALLPDGTFAKIKEVFDNPDPFLIEKALNDFANLQAVPDPIKNQITMLSEEVTRSLDPTGAKSRALTRSQSIELDASSRFDVSKNQSVWIQSSYDEKSNSITATLFLARFNGADKIEVSAVALDPLKYKPLISFIESRGEFIPNSHQEFRR